MAQAHVTMMTSENKEELEDVKTDDETELLDLDETNVNLDENMEAQPPIQAELPKDQPTTGGPTDEVDRCSVTSSLVTGVANLGRGRLGKTVKSESDPMPTVAKSTSKMDTDDTTEKPEAQFYLTKPLPFEMRTLVNLTTLMTAWVVALYECPYPGCMWASQGTKRDDGTIVRPDRWSDFLEHWYCLHMIPALVLKCTIAGCTSASRVFTCTRRLSEHVRGHFKDRKGHDEETRKPLKSALEIFSAHAGAEPDMKALQRTIVYPAHHPTRKQYEREMKDKAEEEKKAADEVKRKEMEEEKQKKKEEEKEKRDRKREDDRKSRHAKSSSTETSHHSGTHTSRSEDKGSSKRDHSAPSFTTELPEFPFTKKAKKDLVADRLSVRHYERCISMECFRQITGSFGALNLAWNSNCKSQMGAAETKISECDMDKEVTCQETDRVRQNLNQFRNDLDQATGHMAFWQEDLGDTPFAVPPSKMLLSPTVLADAQQSHHLREELKTSRNTCNKLSIEVKDLTAQLIETQTKLAATENKEKELIERLSALEIASTPITPATFGGESTILNRPTTRNELALFQAQLSHMNEFMGQFH